MALIASVYSSLVLVRMCRWEFESGPIQISIFQIKTNKQTNKQTNKLPIHILFGSILTKCWPKLLEFLKYLKFELIFWFKCGKILNAWIHLRGVIDKIGGWYCNPLFSAHSPGVTCIEYPWHLSTRSVLLTKLEIYNCMCKCTKIP